ncbi:hypothetical protein BDP27DRAFT_1060962 [Rhodocollybia butyracea]|uniref:Uncharacterized protein n=1 Tax=Rhodocollybia butyracea TaxID=206335 RepID=A0A9P5U3S9_9AGAR|nr:hypothetical protein BDP27DRAFT_1060962 [Rhodocollybia butyracea]
MHFAVLSVTTLIVSSILAVCPLPMNPEPARFSSQLELPPNDNIVTLTFLDVITGKVKSGTLGLKYGSKAELKFRNAVKNTLHMPKGVQFKYLGSDELYEWEEGFFYFELRWKRCQPCFGWIKESASVRPNDNYVVRNQKNYYIGISKGMPGPNQFKDVGGCIGVNPPRARERGRAQEEWVTLRDKARLIFTRGFQRPLPPMRLLPPGRPILTFINGRTGQPKSLEPTQFRPSQVRSAITRTISAVLGVDEQIHYIGLWDPQGKRRWLYFTLIGGPDCTIIKPCFGWLAKGGNVPLDRPYQFPQGFDQTYLAISFGRPGDVFIAFKAYPLLRDGTATVVPSSSGWPWIAKEFADHFGTDIDPDLVIQSR